MQTHSRTDDPATQGFPASCKPRPASLVQLLSFAFAYQFEQVRGPEDFDPEFPRRTEVPFVEGYHIGAQFAATSVISRKESESAAKHDGLGSFRDTQSRCSLHPSLFHRWLAGCRNVRLVFAKDFLGTGP